ncbi:pyridoxal-dependent decarboxylase, exosortase A system-associated [Aestuariicella hydrocarbonica]|uniref:Pyridoxal-dependent decarboxylase, exosortase A system-associated n=1 Tax=Pseudomaricurvus hydrocarbonicus TaxID=1470433 RepID=A0A9E5JSL3_9GAMM|nr:pyridoxal-dependent decarboxylase, exosortase A system-associated [Aestuariicella hydrocarbonica]NHO64666.1 pyridoxal-dependent decarboxylase, exosortase A system-associated [Aestuariicella hydrocarbonica]
MNQIVTPATPQHAPMTQFPVAGNILQVGGQPLTDIARQVRQHHGQRPFYVYDREVMNRQVQALREQLPAGIHLHYAMKANPMPEVVSHLAAQTDGLDVASHGELAIALGTGIDPASISFAGPGKSSADLRAAIEAGVIINMESSGELQRITELALQMGIRPKVAVRVNPDFELKTSGMKMSGGPKPFGVDAEQVPAMLQDIHQRELDFMGFHIFCGSQNLKSDAIIDAQNKTFALARQLADAAPMPLRWLNIGGGLGIPYFPGEQRLALGAIGENLQSLLEHYSDITCDSEVVMELGRYLVAEAGLYVCEVIDVKSSRGETFVVTNGGLHHHLAASGNFGQVIRKNYPVCVANRMTSDSMETVSVVGPLCTPLDILASKMTLPKVQPGDLIALYQSGAYGFSASPQNFLGHPEAIELVV